MIQTHRAEYQRRYSKEYYRVNRDSISKKTADKCRTLRLEAIKLLGGVCVNPFGLHEKPFTDTRVLQIDHVNGGGNRDGRSHSYSYYLKILKEIKSGSKDFQCLCANCNWIKRIENKEDGREML